MNHPAAHPDPTNFETRTGRSELLAARDWSDTVENEDSLRNERYRVRLGVRFLKAQDYVLEYAENLSRGGLFVAGAHELELLEVVTIHVDLPGFGAYNVECRVAHTLSPERAAKANRTPGAGFAIMASPPGFEQALSDYLMLLGRRRDATVLVAGSEAIRELLESAGFQVGAAPPESKIAAALASGRVLAVVVPTGDLHRYRDQLTYDQGQLVIGVDPRRPADDLLNTLDRQVSTLHRAPA